MTMASLRRFGWVVAAVLLSLVVVAATGKVAQRRALAHLAEGARADGQLRSALLTSEIRRFRLLPVALAGDVDLLAALNHDGAPRRTLDVKLEALVRTTGAAVIYVLDAQGRAIAASNWRMSASFVGTDYRFRRYYREAVARGGASQFAMGTVSRRAGLYLVQRTRDAGAGTRGYVVVKLEFDRVEAEWRRAGGITFATDANGVVLVTSRPDWRFAATRALAPAQRAALLSAYQTDAGTLAPLPLAIADPAAAVSLVRVPGDTPMLRVALPATGDAWRLDLLVPIRGIAAGVRTAQLAALLATLALSVGIWGWIERRRRYRERVASALARTAGLETLVADRTAELRREIAERAALETRAVALREGLHQANRLATLGQVTASVAHETAQPVAAIRAYAANGARFLKQGDTGAVAENLAAIGRLTERIGTITDQLRGFARKGTHGVVALPLATAIDGATLILRERLSQVTLTVAPIPADLVVMAGRVRLEQVLVNLLQNAVEALEGNPDPRVDVTVAVEADSVTVSVCDNGPGVVPEVAERIFTPFVTSRAAGLGLGLVISHDIMADMGGALRLVPSDRGARFDLTLLRAP